MKIPSTDHHQRGGDRERGGQKKKKLLKGKKNQKGTGNKPEFVMKGQKSRTVRGSSGPGKTAGVGSGGRGNGSRV